MASFLDRRIAIGITKESDLVRQPKHVEKWRASGILDRVYVLFLAPLFTLRLDGALVNDTPKLVCGHSLMWRSMSSITGTDSS
jgi:hypothetical protein